MPKTNTPIADDAVLLLRENADGLGFLQTNFINN
jgi:hypothetical protein